MSRDLITIAGITLVGFWVTLQRVIKDMSFDILVISLETNTDECLEFYFTELQERSNPLEELAGQIMLAWPNGPYEYWDDHHYQLR